MRIQNTGKDETTCSKTLEGTLTLPASPEIYETLKPEGAVTYKDGKIKIKVKVASMRDLKAQMNSWMRLYQTLKGVEEVSK